MTRTTNARIAGVTFLAYIALGITQMILSGRATRGADVPERLATMAQHAGDVRLVAVLGVATAFVALALGVALWSLTRDEDPDLAMLALACRVGEAVVGVLFLPLTLGLLTLVTATGAVAPDAAANETVATFLFAAGRFNPNLAASFFAVGSTLFAWLLLRGRILPTALAALGLVASLLLVVALPLQLLAVLQGSAAQLVWVPMALFELAAAGWLLVRGAAPPARRSAAAAA